MNITIVCDKQRNNLKVCMCNDSSYVIECTATYILYFTWLNTMVNINHLCIMHWASIQGWCLMQQ